MGQKNGDIIHSSASIAMNLYRKGLMHGAGYNTDRLKERPLIAIANFHSEMTTGRQPPGPACYLSGWRTRANGYSQRPWQSQLHRPR